MITSPRDYNIQSDVPLLSWLQMIAEDLLAQPHLLPSMCALNQKGKLLVTGPASGVVPGHVIRVEGFRTYGTVYTDLRYRTYINSVYWRFLTVMTHEP